MIRHAPDRGRRPWRPEIPSPSKFKAAVLHLAVKAREEPVTEADLAAAAAMTPAQAAARGASFVGALLFSALGVREYETVRDSPEFFALCATPVERILAIARYGRRMLEETEADGG